MFGGRFGRRQMKGGLGFLSLRRGFHRLFDVLQSELPAGLEDVGDLCSRFLEEYQGVVGSNG
jgi:hypothetical protein